MLVYKIMNQNIQILNKTVPIVITLHVYVLIAGDAAIAVGLPMKNSTILCLFPEK